MTINYQFGDVDDHGAMIVDIPELIVDGHRTCSPSLVKVLCCSG